MTPVSRLIDRTARRLAGISAGNPRRAAEPVAEPAGFDRGQLLRTAAAGALALSLGSLPRTARAAGTVSTACAGGSVASCNANGWKTTNATIAFCDRAYLGKPGGEAASYSCYVDAMASRAQGMKECKSNCPKKKPKKPKKPPSGDGGGGGSTAPPADSGPQPTCGFVDCATGDKCCPVQGGGVICCVVGCARSGDGCCSSSSDC